MTLDEEWEGSEPPAANVSDDAKRAGAILDDDGIAPTALTVKRDHTPVASGSDTKLKTPPEGTPVVRADGTTLRELTAGVLLDQHRALLITREVLEALTSVHAGHRRHGDVSPEHIVVLPGLGNDRIKLTHENSKTPDPRYTAPECAFGAADERADIYSVGAVLFELLTGHPPFFADNANEMRRLHAYAPPQTLKQRAPTLTFLEALENIVERALAKKRDARYQTTTEMLESVDNALTAVEAAAPPKQPEPGEPRRKPNDSLLLLAKELMVQPSAGLAQNEPLVPVNIDRHVPELPATSRAMIRGRKLWARARALASKLWSRFRALDRRMQIGIASGAGVVLLALVIVTCSGGGSKGDAKPKPKPSQVSAPAASADEAEAATEAEAPVDPADPVVASLEKLGSAQTCEERRDAIAELADSADERALPALKKAKTHRCTAKSAAAAIKKITADAKRR